MIDRLVEVLELFAEAQELHGVDAPDIRHQPWAIADERRGDGADRRYQPLASIRKAYQMRNREAGLCRACPRVVATSRKGRKLAYCEKHREENRQRARRSLGMEEP